jgi:hypothetical protein
VIYQTKSSLGIQTAHPIYAPRNAPVVVRENWNGDAERTIEAKGKPLPYTVYHRQARQGKMASRKRLDLVLEPLTQPAQPRKPSVPPPDHPWRRFRLDNKSKQPTAPSASVAFLLRRKRDVSILR